MYPDDCVQAFVEPTWWDKDAGKDLRRGRLVWVFVPISDQIPIKLTVTGRSEPTEHNSALVKLEPLRVRERQRKTPLPVAAIPQYENEERGVYRVKRRPAIIVADGSEEVPRQVTLGKSKRNTAPMILVAPSFGCDEGKGRDGYRQEFIDLVRRGTFPQFFWDKLPLPGASESIIRLDQIQPIGRHNDAVEATEYCLSREALEVLDDWIHWYIYEIVPKDGVLALLKEAIDLT
ncbi:MAG: hypothetical protein IH614_19195 [Desulfuromonadales bacterium]|nr:hypothetical protein [Desulfuromonadales bacterium]